MRYENPSYKLELLESMDVLTASEDAGEQNGVTVTEKSETEAEVSVNANDVLF